MEIGGNTLSGGHSIGNRGQNGNNPTTTSSNLAWDIWELSNSSRMDWTNTTNNNTFYTAPAPAAAETSSAATRLDQCPVHALVLTPRGYGGGCDGDGGVMLHHDGGGGHLQHQQSLYAGDGSHLHPDPHLMCLKLGKRHYFEDATSPLSERHVSGFSIGKRGKPLYGGGGGTPSSSSSSVSVPRCQVEGCHVALVNAKDYHRRHKVCEMHSKAPKVVVLGLEQRFCQQCSRFHVVSEFDESKRSCRRRLAGHNERRRKSSHDSVTRNSSHENKLMGGRFPCLSSSTGRALSLLSSKADSWVPPSDLSSRSSAALRELIAENRAAILARQIVMDRDWHSNQHGADQDLGDPQQRSGFNSIEPNRQHHHHMFPEQHSWDRFQENGTHVTLDLMQASGPNAFGFLSARGKTKSEEEECSDLWNSLNGPNLV